MENNTPPFAGEQAPVLSNIPPSNFEPMVMPQSQSSWPTVIGIISIVLGSLAALGGVYQAIAPFLMSFASSIVPENDEQAGVMFEAMAKWRFPLLGVGLVALVLGVMLIISGARMVGRHFDASGLHKKWAISKIIYSLIAVAITSMAQMQQMEMIMEQQSQAAGGPGAEFVKTAMLVGMVVGLFIGIAWQCAYPIFILIWFSRQKVKNEMQTWSDAPSNVISD
jgi:uncharacterized membrane protein HdeD (DUF308 family)